MVRVFPCSALGGPSYLKALKAPLPQIDLFPSGGVTLQNAAAFIDAGACVLGVGRDLVDLTSLREGRLIASRNARTSSWNWCVMLAGTCPRRHRRRWAGARYRWPEPVADGRGRWPVYGSGAGSGHRPRY